MKKLVLKFVVFSIIIMSLSCSKEDTVTVDEPTYKIINNGNGGVNQINDTDDSENLSVVQAIPSVAGKSYSTNMPIILFMNDKIYLNSLKENINVTMNGEIIGGTIVINESANGFAILTFIPKKPFTSNATIVITLTTNVLDDAGNGFQSDFTLSFLTSSSDNGVFDGNSSFEKGLTGVYIEGDGAILEGSQGCVSPTDGNKFCAISTGSKIVSSGSAIGTTTSTCIVGPIEKDISSLQFNYNFLSAEFNEYVGSKYDDSFIVTVFGPKGAYTEFVTSVNIVGKNNNQCSNFPNMPDKGNSYVGSTDWVNKNINFSNVGQPAFVVFTVTDVADSIYSSVVNLDEIKY